MTPDGLRAALASLRWSQPMLAEIVGVHERRVRRWAAGEPIPPPIAAWLEDLAAYHDSHPPPPPPGRAG